jgi:hypothetical protein
MATEEQKKKSLQRRLNPNLSPGTPPEEDPKKKPKLSIYWVYGIIFALIIGYNLFRTTTGSGVEINNTDF